MSTKNHRLTLKGALSAAVIIPALLYYSGCTNDYKSRVVDQTLDDKLVAKASSALSFDKNLDLHSSIYKAGPEDYKKSKDMVYTNMVAGYSAAFKGILKAEFGKMPPKNAEMTFKSDFFDKEINNKGIDTLVDTVSSMQTLGLSYEGQKAFQEALKPFSETQKQYLSEQISKYVKAEVSGPETQKQVLSYFQLN